MKKVVKLTLNIPIILVVATVGCMQNKSTNQTRNFQTMKNIEDVYPVIISRKLEETVNFYVERFNFNKIFESTFFVLLQSDGDRPFSIAFMEEVHPTAPPSPGVFSGAGFFLTIQVADAQRCYEALKNDGFDIPYTIADEPWGQKRFGLTDPNGIWVDVVQQTTPQEGYWDKYVRQ